MFLMFQVQKMNLKRINSSEEYQQFTVYSAVTARTCSLFLHKLTRAVGVGWPEITVRPKLNSDGFLEDCFHVLYSPAGSISV